MMGSEKLCKVLHALLEACLHYNPGLFFYMGKTLINYDVFDLG